MKRQQYLVGRHDAAPTPPAWDAATVQALRRHLGQTQQELAGELGVRQQTVSEWETGVYRPRGGSLRLLSMVAERASFPYHTNQISETRISLGGRPRSMPA